MRFLVWPILKADVPTQTMVNIDHIKSILPFSDPGSGSPPKQWSRLLFFDGDHMDIDKPFADIVTEIQGAEP